MFLLFIAGFSFFAKAKWSVIKQGNFITFGSANMSKQNRLFYYLGYSVMGLGLVLYIGFALALAGGLYK